MPDWTELAREARTVTAEVVRRYRPAAEAAEVERLASSVVDRLRGRADYLTSTVDTPEQLVDFRRFVEILAEFTVVGIGEAITREIERVARRVARGAPDLDDVVSDVVETLLDRNKKELTYIIDVASWGSDFEGLVGMHVARRRSRLAQRTVLDNLLGRCRQLLKQEPFVEIGRIDGLPAYSLRGREARLVRPDAEDLAAATRRVWKIPKVRLGTGERASMLYTTDSLRGALEAIADSVPGAFTVRDVAEVLRPALISYLPIVDHDEGRLDDTSGPRPDPEDEVLGDEAARRILEDLSGEARDAVALMLLEAKKVEVAPMLRRTRPTVDRRLEDEARPIFLAALEGLSPSARAHALASVAAALNREALVLTCEALLREEPFVHAGEVGGVPTYSLAGREAELRRPTPAELDEASALVPAPGDDQALVYSPAWFRLALREIATVLPSTFTAVDAVETLERRLTRWR